MFWNVIVLNGRKWFTANHRVAVLKLNGKMAKNDLTWMELILFDGLVIFLKELYFTTRHFSEK